MKRGNVRKTKKNSTVSQRDGTWRSVNERTGRGGKEKGICFGGERGWVEEEKLRGYPCFLGGRDRDGRSGITTRGR